MEWPMSKDVTDIRSFMGLASYYRRFVEGFLRVAYPITFVEKKEKKPLNGLQNAKEVLSSSILFSPQHLY